jgi:hypothetical protein
MYTTRQVSGWHTPPPYLLVDVTWRTLLGGLAVLAVIGAVLVGLVVLIALIMVAIAVPPVGVAMAAKVAGA